MVYVFRRKDSPKEVNFSQYNSSEEHLIEPIISTSFYTVDVRLNHRYLNYTHPDYPNHIGILQGQYIEIDWNIFNADLITISGVGLVKSVGRKAFYPKENTTYTITARNKEYEVVQTIFVRVFPQQITTQLFSKQPNIRIKSEQVVKSVQPVAFPSEIKIQSPKITIQKPVVEKLESVIQDKIAVRTLFQKIKDYLSLNNKFKNTPDGRL